MFSLNTMVIVFCSLAYMGIVQVDVVHAQAVDQTQKASLLNPSLKQSNKEGYIPKPPSQVTQNTNEQRPPIERLDDHRIKVCLLYTSPSPRDKRQSRMPSSA